jgi:uncharacterized membrane protein YhaH (DUF805 family)
MLNFDWLSGISMTGAKAIFIGLFALIGILVLFIPNEYVYQGLKEHRWYHNLKFWAWALLFFIASVYYIF